MAAFDKFGLDKIDLPTHTGFEYEPVVPGRTSHIDADFLCYMASAETRDEKDGLKPKRTLEEMEAQVMSIAEHYRRLVRAEFSELHITPSGSNKGGRDALAVLKPYQGNRKDKAKPEHLDHIRAYIGEQPNGVVHLDQEADDGMTQANYFAWKAGQSDLSVIVSKDKDLRMAPGLHWDFDDEVLVDVDMRFGMTWLDRSKSTAKGTGWGTKFFWLQMLMGDTADNISGLPLVHGESLALVGIGKKGQKPRRCGPALAVSILEGLETDLQCWDTVKWLWETSPTEWMHHRTGLPATWKEAMMGDAQLLWMRRTKDDTVIKWIVNEVQV